MRRGMSAFNVVAVVLLCLLVVPIVIYQQMQTRDLAGSR